MLRHRPRPVLWILAVALLAAPMSAGEATDPAVAEEGTANAEERADDSEAASAKPSTEADRSSSPLLEQIAVTARRYEEYLQVVPAAVNVMTDAYLEEQGLENVREIVDFSPGGFTTAFNKMQDRYSLRGISSQAEGSSGDSSVPIVIDNVVVSREFMKSQTFFDVEHVEVLRGPQGTAFGRNASSGLIHLKTAKPKRDFSSGLTAELGSYESYGVETFVTGAMNDSTAGRFALRFDQLGGYTEDTRTGDLLGGTQNLGLRGSVLFEPSAKLDVFLKAEYSRDDDDDPSPRKGKDCTIDYQGDFPEPSIVGAPQPSWSRFPNFRDSCDPWETTVSAPTYLGDYFLEREIVNLTSEVTWELGNDVALTAVSAYLNGVSDYLIETHGGPNNSLFQSTQNDAWQMSHEIRFDNHRSVDRFRWLAGVYYLRDDQTRDDQNIFFVDNAVFDPQHPSGFRPESRDIKQQNNETTSYGLFGEASFDVTGQLNFTLGARWSDDEKDYSVAHYGWGWGGPIAGLTDGIDADGDGVFDEQCAFDPGGPPDFGLRFCGSPENPVGFRTPVPTSHSWDNLSLKASAKYTIDLNNMVYGLVSQGYKTGGFQNEPFNPFDAVLPYDEETVVNYEVGYRGTLGNRFRLNTAVFSTDYEDLQLFLFINTPNGFYNQVTANAGGADVLGIELDFLWQITNDLRFSGSYAALDAQLTDTLIDTDGDFVAESFSGSRPDGAPEWTGTAVLEYRRQLRRGSSLTVRGDWRGISNVFDGIGEDPDREHEGYGVVGARVTWRPPGAIWSVALWGRNLFEEAYTTNVGPYQPNVNQLNFFYGPPRAVGLTLTRRLF